MLSVNSGQALIDEVLIQRRIELWGEGRNWTGLKRLNLPFQRPSVPDAGTGVLVASIATTLDVPACGNIWT